MRECWSYILGQCYRPFGEKCNDDHFTCKYYKIKKPKAFIGTIQQLQKVMEGDRLRPYIMYPENEDMIYNYLCHGLKGFVGGQEYVDIMLRADNPTMKGA